MVFVNVRAEPHFLWVSHLKQMAMLGVAGSKVGSQASAPAICMKSLSDLFVNMDPN